MKKFIVGLGVVAVLVTPLLSMAIVSSFGGGPSTGVDTYNPNPSQKNLPKITGAIGDAIRILVPAMTALLVITFFYGLAKYVLSAGDPEKAAEGKSMMIYGALAMFIGLAIWGVVGYLEGFFATQDASSSKLVLPTPTSY